MRRYKFGNVKAEEVGNVKTTGGGVMKNSTYKKILGKIPAGVFVFGKICVFYMPTPRSRALSLRPVMPKKQAKALKAAHFSTSIFPAPFARGTAEKNNRPAEKRRSAVIARCTA